jgi:hypothetical protein
MNFNYSEDDKKKIEEYNNNRVRKSLELLTYNRDKLLNDDEYIKLSMTERIRKVQQMEDFKVYCVEFPMVSKYIIAYGLFSTKAFKKYMDWKARVRPSDELRNKLAGNQLEQEKFKNKYVYSVYMKYLYAEKNPRSSLKDINSAYISTYEQLNKETEEFFNMYESAKQEAQQKEEHILEKRKEELIKQLKKKVDLERNN